jgi:hypothetical protein
MVAGAPDSSFAGKEREYFFWLLNRISRPPLRTSAFRCDKRRKHERELDRYRDDIVVGHFSILRCDAS